MVEHWRIAAWIAKQSGCKGILFDPEPYTPPHAQFGYAAQPGRAQHSFNQYAAKARQRGREVMQAVVKEYPQHHALLLLHEQRERGGGGASRSPAGIGRAGLRAVSGDDRRLARRGPAQRRAGRWLRIGLPLQQPSAIPGGGLADEGGLPGIGFARESGQVPGPGPGQLRHLPRRLLDPQGLALVYRRAGRPAGRASADQHGRRPGRGRRVRLGLRRAVPLVAHAQR